MQIIRALNYEDMCRKAAGLLAAQVLLEPRSVLGLATGSTPLGIYRRLIQQYRQGDIDFSGVTAVNLDEYAGLSPQNGNSYAFFMRENLFDHINIPPQNTHIPNGMAEDAEGECARYEGLLAACGGIDMQLLGLGHNGHIAFNEPGPAFANNTHHVALSASTIGANTRFFEREADVPRHAYTMGIGSILRARRILLVASGKNKAPALWRALRGPVSPALPASALQLHGHVTVIADEEALSSL